MTTTTYRVDPANTTEYPSDAILPELDSVVIVRENLYPPALCRRVVHEMLAASDVRSGVHKGMTEEVINTEHRSSSFCRMPPTVEKFFEYCVTATVNQLLSGNSVLPLVVGEPLQFLKYDEVHKGHFLAHTDNAYFDAEGKFHYTSPQRVVTAVSYMNSDFEGGEIVLNSVRGGDGNPVVIKPKEGTIVIFPSDTRFMHEVRPVTKGVRCNVVSWFNTVHWTK